MIEAHKPHSIPRPPHSRPMQTLTDPRERIALMRHWNTTNVGDYWEREADFWEGFVEQHEALRKLVALYEAPPAMSEEEHQEWLRAVEDARQVSTPARDSDV